MKKLFTALTVLLVLLRQGGLAQVVVRGVVLDARQKPLPAASVGVPGTYAGASTEADGSFSFELNSRGPVQVVARMIGYTEQTLPVTLTDTTRTLWLTFELAETSYTLDHVVVKSRKQDFMARTGFQRLNPLEVRAMGGSNADITNAFRAMPGVQSNPDATGLFVRGGTGEEAKVYIDGLLATNYFYNGNPDVGQRGRFAPELFSGNYFSSGGYSALFGQALSSTLILETNDVATRSTFGGNLSSIGGALEASGVLKPGRASAGVTLSYNNLTPYYRLVPQRRDFDQNPVYLDGTFYAKYKAGEKGTLKLLGSLGCNAVSFAEKRLGQHYRMGVESDNFFSSLQYTGELGKTLTVNAGFAVSTQSNRFELDSLAVNDVPRFWKGARQTDQQTYHSRVVFRKLLTNATDLYWGVEQMVTRTTFRRFLNDEQAWNRPLDDHYTAAFAESNLSLAPRWQARIGLRTEGSSLLRDTRLSPRMTLTYGINRHSRLTASYGHFYQTPAYEYLIRRPERLTFQRAEHFILGFQKATTERTLRVEAFRKNYDRLLLTLTDTSSGGRGYARGLEVFWKESGRIRNLDYWVSYSFLDTRRQFLHYPIMAQPTFAARHTLVTVTNLFIPRIPMNVGLTYTLASGRPYENPARPAAQFLTDRTPVYQNLGLTVAWLGKLFRSNSILAFSMNNVLGNRQIFGYRYYSLTDREAITPMAPRFYYLGLFLNWGVDKRAQTVNNLLN